MYPLVQIRVIDERRQSSSVPRLFPLTKITNKHLLPIYDKPMIYYRSFRRLAVSIHEILVVTGGLHDSGDFLRLLGNGKTVGAHLNYTYQEGEGGG